MRKPKDLRLNNDFSIEIDSFKEVLIRNFNAYQTLKPKEAKRLGKWLIQAAEYIEKRKKPKIRTTGDGFIV